MAPEPPLSWGKGEYGDMLDLRVIIIDGDYKDRWIKKMIR